MTLPGLDTILTWQQLCSSVESLGFLPLLDCGIPGFSVKSLTPPELWLSRSENNPWEWRYHAADSGRIVYGKLFGRKVGFASKKWFPVLANHRRSGYDFDAACDEGLMPSRLKQLMALFEGGATLSSMELKSGLIFGGGSLEDMLTELMMRTYLVIPSFRRKTNKYGEEYGWPAACYCSPETMLGERFRAEAYSEPPEASKAKLLAHLKALLPDVPEKRLDRFIG